MSEEEPDNGGTTDQDYRWKWLATLFTGAYGLGYPAWLAGSTVLEYSISLDGATMGVLTLVWLACVVYIVGPETVKTAQSIRGG